MPMPYEETLVFPHPWDVVFEAAERCCDEKKRILLSSDRSTGRLVVHVRKLGWYGASLVVDVGAAADGSIVRVGAVSGGPVDWKPALRYHVRDYLQAVDDFISKLREVDAGR